jgi:DNA-binding NarL/FixJ family response regulator
VTDSELLAKVFPLRKERQVASINRLTPRETAVLKVLCSGASNDMIAASLGIAVRTVKNHLDAIMDKLACERTRLAVVVHALRNGLVT